MIRVVVDWVYVVAPFRSRMECHPDRTCHPAKDEALQPTGHVLSRRGSNSGGESAFDDVAALRP